MSLKDVFLQVSERSSKAAQSSLDNNVHELAAFLTYHAFESVGGALCESYGITYPRPHRKKI